MGEKKNTYRILVGKSKRMRQLGRPKHGRNHGTNIDFSRNSGFIWLCTEAHGGLFATVMNHLVSLIVCLRTCYLLNNNVFYSKNMTT